MKLGILVNTDRHLVHVVGIAKAAVAKGHKVIMFAMGDGTKLLGAPEFSELCRTAGISTSFCSYNAQGLGVHTAGLPPEIAIGSQYHNAAMNHSADRVIIL